MANGFAEQSKGGFAITSKVGEGTVASLWLPESDATGPRPAAPADTRNVSPTLRQARILLTDDQQPVRHVLASELADYGYEVLQAEDGEAALRILQAEETIDLLISDLRMPGMDGIALIKEAQKRRPALQAILLTGYAGDSISFAHDAMAGSSVTLVRKPVTGPQLADHAAMLLEAMADV
jgi:DNA-binding NtrC family response regulator